MEGEIGFNKLHQWQHQYGPGAVVISGSATPAFTLKELIDLSTDSDATRAAFDFTDLRFSLGNGRGSSELRQVVAGLYDAELAHLTEDDIVIANGTTGSNHVVQSSLLKSGDHVIVQYPIYGPSIEEPQHIGCDISYLQLNPNHAWRLDIDQLSSLIRPSETKMLILNNPVNPTGTHIDSKTQREIIQLCKKHDIILHVDEVFWPLFHEQQAAPSFMEHSDLHYNKVVVTGSMSKVYGLSGVRIGWIASKSLELQKTFLSYRVRSCISVSTIDEAIAIEALGPRCRPRIVQKHHKLAQTNLLLIQHFIDKNAHQCSWSRPTAGSVGFVKFIDPRNGNPVDDVEFCKNLLAAKNVLLSPASFCFEFGALKEACVGRVRMHFTATTETLQKGLGLLQEFLDEQL